MSNVITKAEAKISAEKILIKHKEKIDKLKKSLAELCYTEFMKTVPKEVQSLMKTHPEYLSYNSTVYVTGAGIAKEYQVKLNGKSVPHVERQWSSNIKSNDAVTKAVNEIKDLEKKYEDLLLETSNTLLTLRSFNRITKEFPEAMKHINKTVPSLLPAVNVQKLKVKINTV